MNLLTFLAGVATLILLASCSDGDVFSAAEAREIKPKVQNFFPQIREAARSGDKVIYPAYCTQLDREYYEHLGYCVSDILTETVSDNLKDYPKQTKHTYYACRISFDLDCNIIKKSHTNNTGATYNDKTRSRKQN